MEPGGFKGSRLQESNCEVPSIHMLIYPEDWENGLGSDFHRRGLVGETSYQMAGMQTVQRIKRQNCRNNVPGHHNLISGSRDQIGSGFAVTHGDAEGIMSHSPWTMSAGLNGFADQGNRKVQESNFQNGPIEVGSSSGSFGFPSYVGSFLRGPAAERGSLLHQASDPVGSLTSNSYPQSSSGSRSSCKRKSSMDEVIGSVGSLTFRPFIEQRETDLSRFSEEAGTSRADSGFSSTSSYLVSTSRIPVLDESPRSSESNMMHQAIRPWSSDLLQIGRNRYYGGHLNGSQEICQASAHCVHTTRVLPDVLPSHMRGTLSHEHPIQPARIVHESSPFNQGNTSSAVAPWFGHGSVPVESINHPNFHRELSAGINMGSHARNLSNGASIWMGIPPWTQNAYDSFSGVSSVIPYRQSSSQSSYLAPVHHMPSSSAATLQHPPAPLTGHTNFCSQGGLYPYSPASRGATGSMVLGSQAAAPGNAYPSYGLFNRFGMPPPLLGYAESGGASPLHNFSGMPFRRPEMERSGGPPRLPSHEAVDRAFTYNGFNVYDQHLALQPDVDNMSYEELLALEERIGNVNTGLSGESIIKCLKTSRHSSYDVTKSRISQETEIKCSVCQEEYMEGDEIGQLACNHGYHTVCIKQWLELKNQCPICKAAALSLP